MENWHLCCNKRLHYSNIGNRTVHGENPAKKGGKRKKEDEDKKNETRRSGNPEGGPPVLPEKEGVELSRNEGEGHDPPEA